MTNFRSLCAVLFVVAAGTIARAETIVHRSGVTPGAAIATGGTFSVEMPVAFSDVEVRVADGGQGLEIGRILSGKSGEGVKFTATEIPIVGRVKPLHTIADDMKGRPGATLSDLVQTQQGDLETISFAITDLNGGVFVRVLRTASAGYSLAVEYPVRERSRASELKDGYFASFRLLKPEASMPQAKP